MITTTIAKTTTIQLQESPSQEVDPREPNTEMAFPDWIATESLYNKNVKDWGSPVVIFK